MAAYNDKRIGVDTVENTSNDSVPRDGNVDDKISKCETSIDNILRNGH